MSKKNDITNFIQENEMQLESFRKQFNIEPEKFKKAVKFCEEVIDAKEPKNRIYSRIFEVPIAEANKVASQFHRAKWIQELILFLRPDEGSLYFGERKRIIAAGMAIIDDPTESARNKTEAMKALTPYIKQEKLENEINVQVETKGESISAGITKQLSELAEQGKMINDAGEIIEVQVIE